MLRQIVHSRTPRPPVKERVDGPKGNGRLVGKVLDSASCRSIAQNVERHIRFELIPSGWKPEMLPLNTSDANLVDPQRLELWYHASRACVLAARRRAKNMVLGRGFAPRASWV
jgi:hypothetical protein